MQHAKANLLTEAINTAFADIGKIGSTVMPRSRNVVEHLAWEFFIAHGLKSAAERRDKLAFKECVSNGVIFNHVEKPMGPGTKARVYLGDVVQIEVDVGNPRTRFDADAFCLDLEKTGLSRAVIAKLRTRHTHATAAPHSFSASLVTG